MVRSEIPVSVVLGSHDNGDFGNCWFLGREVLKHLDDNGVVFVILEMANGLDREANELLLRTFCGNASPLEAAMGLKK